jgi:TonB family protein
MFFICASLILHILLCVFIFFVYSYDNSVPHLVFQKGAVPVRFSATPVAAHAMYATPKVNTTAFPKKMRTHSKRVTSLPGVAVSVNDQSDMPQKAEGTRAAVVSDKTVQKKNIHKKKISKPKPILKAKSVKKDIKDLQTPVHTTDKHREQVLAVEPTKIQEVKEHKDLLPVQHNELQPTIDQESANPDLDILAQECTVALGQTVDNPYLVQYYTQLQNALSDSWRPPQGMNEECTCDIAAQLDTQGVIQEVKIVKSSGVLIYDIAARNALQEAKMPRWTHGRTITITFKQ